MAKIAFKDEESTARSQEADFFNEKLRLINKDCFELEGENVLVVPTHPDILSGGHVFNTVYDKLGNSLMSTLQPYACLEAGSCKMIQTPELANYKKLAMCVLPELYEDEGLTRLDRVKVSMCIADALDLAAETSCQNIVFTHWPIASVEQSAEILLLCLAHWIRYSVYSDRIKRISVSLDDEETFSTYYEVTKLIEEDPSLILDVLQERRPDDSGNDQLLDQDLNESMQLDFTDPKVSNHRESNDSRLDHQYNNQNGSAPFLFYSRNLSTSILSIEQPDSSIRQYRLSTAVEEKNTHYFRCSRCDYLSRNTAEFEQFRPKITVRDGAIVSSRFPEHHPACRSTSKEKFVVQQLDRLWKAVAIYETEELRRCYVELRNIAQKEADALYTEIESSTGRFPEWEVLKQMAEKYHNQYSFRLIKCNPMPNVSGIDIQQYSEIRRVEDEIDGVKNTTFAWITAGEFEDDEHEDSPKVATETRASLPSTSEPQSSAAEINTSESTSTKAPQTRPHRIIRSTYKIRPGSSGNSAQSNVKFRIVRPPKSPEKRSQT